MPSMGERILLINTSARACYLDGHTFLPGDRLEVVLAADFDPLADPGNLKRGPWGMRGWTLEQIKPLAAEIRHASTKRLVWRGEHAATRWQDYAERHRDRQHTVVGTLKVLPQLWSPQLENERDILVYLPPSYGQGQTRYPVIYMHDGQNLFDQATSFSCEWQVDETLEAASHGGLEAIVVGIPNMGEQRCDEYSPFVDAKHGGGRGTAYLSFLVETIKPRIDRDFRTIPDRAHTGILGSSMGGLISLYAFFHHADTFGFAGVMSPSLWFARRAIFDDVKRKPFVPGKLYLDVGTDEGLSTLRDTRRMHALLRHKGYRGEQLLRYVEEQGAGHCEAAWAGRLHAALRFLLRDARPLALAEPAALPGIQQAIWAPAAQSL